MSNNTINIVANGDYGLDDFHSGSGEIADQYTDLVDKCHGKKSGDVDYDAIYCRDKVAQKLLSVPVYDALSNWRDGLTGNAKSHDDRLMFVDVVKKAAIKSRLHGKALILPIVTYIDTQRRAGFSLPLDRITRPATINTMVVHAGNIEFGEIETDISSVNFGLPKTYKIGDIVIHHTRGILFGGACSFFDSIAPQLKDFHQTGARLQEAIRRNNAFIYKADFDAAAQHVQNMMTAGGSGSAQTLLQAIADLKAQTAKKNLAENNVLVIGQNESIERIQEQNISDLIDAYTQQMEYICGLSDNLASRTFGIVKSGLGDSSNRMLQVYSQALDTFRSEEIDPPLHELDAFFAQIYRYTFSRNYKWNNTKAEEMLIGDEPEVISEE